MHPEPGDYFYAAHKLRLIAEELVTNEEQGLVLARIANEIEEKGHELSLKV